MTVKKRISFILVLALMCALLTGCQKDEPKLAADAQKEKASNAAAQSEAEQGEQEEVETLRVVTDKYIWADGDRTLLTKGPQAFEEMVAYYEGTPSGIEVQLDVLPDLNGSYEAELTHIRTEIMSGAGPDVFLLSGFGGSYPGLPENTLFQNPEHAMASGFFLPLDDYLETAKIMEWDELEPHVMKAGQYDGKQYIMPLTYLIPRGILRQEPDSLPEGWDVTAAAENPELRQLYAQSVVELPGFRETVFGQVADNLDEELLIDSDELFQRTKEALGFYREFGERATESIVFTNPWTSDCYYADGTDEADGAYTFFPLRNSQGGVAAAVEGWCAVNKNTKHPEDAFFIVDMLMGREFQSHQMFWPTNLRDPGHLIPLLKLGTPGSLPTYSSLVTSSTGGYLVDVALIGESQREGLKDTQANITYAYLTSNVDRALDDMFMELVERVDKGETLTDEEIRRATDKCYSTMKMMLAES